MIKPRHYGLVTALAAVMITVLPAGVFVLIGRSPFLDDRRASSAPSAELNELIEAANERPETVVPAPRDVGSPARTVARVPVAAVARVPVASTTLTTPKVAQATVTEPMVAAQPVVDATPAVSDSNSYRSPFSDGATWGSAMDLAERVASSDVKAIKPTAVNPVPTPVGQEPSTAMGGNTGNNIAATDMTQSEMAPPTMIQMPTSVADATGHKIGSQGVSGRTSISSAAETAGSRSGKQSKSRIKKKMPGDIPMELLEAAYEPPAEAIKYVDMIVKTPSESRRVGRVENVVAVTNETGWPIALISSDLPDSRWWVQQMTAIRGNAFSARVNFGNDTSISGSKYHLMFVFLETQDELRRFQIAKQFKEIPAGVRRSRKYTFVRR